MSTHIITLRVLKLQPPMFNSNHKKRSNRKNKMALLLITKETRARQDNPLCSLKPQFSYKMREGKNNQVHEVVLQRVTANYRNNKLPQRSSSYL